MTLIHIIPASLLFVVSPTFCALWIPLWFLSILSIKLFIYLDEKLYSIYQRCVVLFYEHVTNTKVIFYGDHEAIYKGKENVLYICNHQSTVDWVISDVVIARQHGIGRLRYILKEELKYIPLYGFYFYKHGCIYVNRKQFQKDKAIQSMKYLMDNKISSWLVVFPEGTRFDKKKTRVIEQSRQFAEKQGLTPLKYHLTPRSKGLELVMENLGDHLDAFYNVTVLFEEESNYNENRPWKRSLPGMFEWFRSPKIVHVNIERIKMDTIPRGGDDLRAWLHGLFVQKDQLMEKILTEEISSQDSKWPLKNPKRISLPIYETLPCFLFLFGITIFLWSTFWGCMIYFGITFGFGLFGIIYARVLI